MSKKVHIGRVAGTTTPSCAPGISAHRSSRVKPSITLPIDEFRKLPKERQCMRCARRIDTTDFSKQLGALILGVRDPGSTA